jgi:hypothetical protein
MTTEFKKAIEAIKSKRPKDYKFNLHEVGADLDLVLQVLDLVFDQCDSLFTMLEERGVETAELRQEYDDQLEKLLKAGG